MEEKNTIQPEKEKAQKKANIPENKEENQIGWSKMRRSKSELREIKHREKKMEVRNVKRKRKVKG